MVSRNLLAAFMEEEAPQSSKRRAWDDEFVLKRQFSALIPAFDPRPGRTNINQVRIMKKETDNRSQSLSYKNLHFHLLCRQRIWKYHRQAAKHSRVFE